MIRQRQRDAVAQRRLGQLLAGVEQDAAVAAVAQLRIELAKGLDQIGLAVEIDRVAAGFRLHLVDPDRAAAPALGREIARLPPFQRLFQRADAFGGVSGIKDQPAQRQQSRLDRSGIGTEGRIHRGLCKRPARPGDGALCGSLLRCRLLHPSFRAYQAQAARTAHSTNRQVEATGGRLALPCGLARTGWCRRAGAGSHGSLALPRCSRLLGRARPRCRGPARSGLATARAADPAAALGGNIGVLDAAARAALVAAAGFLVDGRPGAPLGFLRADAALLVAFLDMLGLAFLLVGVARFVTAGHAASPSLLRLLKSNARRARGFRWEWPGRSE